jgi:hypothetical protein
MDNRHVHNLLALATDVLAQSEARQRAARRLHQTVSEVGVAIRESGSFNSLQMQKLRDQTAAIKSLGDTERMLLEEFDAAIAELGR